MDEKIDKKETTPKTFNDYIQEINLILLESPQSLNISLKKENEKHFYDWDLKDTKSKQIRKKIRRVLLTMWQTGSYNYGQIASVLRVDNLAIQALVDEEFVNNNPHLL